MASASPHAHRPSWRNEDPRPRFQLIEELGRGSFAVVHSAVVRDTGEQVAIKVVTLAGASSQDLELLHTEVSLLASLHDSSIVSFHSAWCWSHDGDVQELWVVQELCEGGSLSDFIAHRGPLSEEATLECAVSMLRGLAFLHARGVLHRDLKGANVLLTESAQLKLCDLGVAAVLSDQRTRRFTFVGTPLWMAPEVLTTENGSAGYDERADVWSLGITLIEVRGGIQTTPTLRCNTSPLPLAPYSFSMEFRHLRACTLCGLSS